MELNCGFRLVRCKWQGGFLSIAVTRVCVQVAAPMFFHFDVAEPVKKQANLVVLPTWSSVLYLSNCGGSTVILDNVLGTENDEFTNWTHHMQPEYFSGAMLISPRKNQLLIFPGNQLHGVLPVTSQSTNMLQSPKGQNVVTVTGRKGKNSIINGVYRWNATQQRFTRPYDNTHVMLWETPSRWMIGDKANYNTTVGYAMLTKNGWHVVGSSFEFDPLVTMESGDLQHIHFCNRTTLLMNWWQHTVLMKDFDDSRIELKTQVALEEAQQHHPVMVEPEPILLSEDAELEIRLPGEKMKRCTALPLPARSTTFSKVHWQQIRLSYNCSPGHGVRQMPQECPVCRASCSSKAEGSELMALRMHLEEQLNSLAQRELNETAWNKRQVSQLQLERHANLEAQAQMYKQFEAQLTLAKNNEISRLMSANTQVIICAGLVIMMLVIVILVQLHVMHRCADGSQNNKKVQCANSPLIHQTTKKAH